MIIEEEMAIRSKAVPMIQSAKNEPAIETLSVAATLKHHLNSLFSLCCRLEHIADNLPNNVDRQECLFVARSIHPLVRRAHDFEEEVLFPVLRESGFDSDSLRETLDRLQCEHWEDESFAEEIQQELYRFVREPKAVNPESLGYMLRGFFEGMRRHLAFEREHVMPLLTNVGSR